MSIVKVSDREFKLFIERGVILDRVKEVAKVMSNDLRDKNPLFVVVLNGSFVFAADLLRELDFPCEISFVKLASYVGTSSTVVVKHLLGLNEDITNRTVVVVEDIIDSGFTMVELLKLLSDKNPANILISALFVKPDNLKVELDIAYSCFDIGNDFIVGYGLDYNHEGRNLPDIYKVVE